MTSNFNKLPLIQLKNLTKKYDNKVIVKNLNLTINQGEFLTILGPSGCGKTTVLRMIAGLENVDSGTIMLEDSDITNLPAEKRQINTVFQNYSLFPHMTVFENVAFGLRMKGVKTGITEKVEAALQMVRLNDFAQRKPANLSGGQQQRVAIARAVVNEPKILLLDESLSALDYKLRLEMQSELKRIQRKLGITFFFVTHDQEEALTMSDRIIVMRDGIIEQDGTPREIYEEPKNLFVAQFIGEINIFDVVVIGRINDDEVLVNCEGEYEVSIHYTKPVTPGKKLKVLLRPEDLRIVEVTEDYQGKDGMIGKVKERNYKGMTLDSNITLINTGKRIQSSEFFNEDDPDVDHSLNQIVLISWVPSWEVVLDE